jgi:indole-3-glycerol phosphate synthase
MKKTDVLKNIIAKKKERLLSATQSLPEEELKLKIQGLPPTRPFIEAISKPRVISLIAEIKKASPSRGVIRENFDPKDIAASYQDVGVQAISVLTEEDYFMGNLGLINEIKSLVTVPVLRKDFILEPYQVYESRFYGADAILLIADLLSKEKLADLMRLSGELGMDCLVEAHSEKELKKVLGVKAPLIGINNRDLRTLEVDFKTTEKLFTLIPRDKIIVVESGIKSYQDILFLKVLGVHAVLIGEAFMSAENIRKKVEEVMGW